MRKAVTAISNGKLSSPESLAYQEKILVTEISAMTQERIISIMLYTINQSISMQKPKHKINTP